ncbi:SCO family protein [Albimonas sp. CAU 1670]|uniref:SCO family protein n=1 Tax=Albimonas sp. CAU 1670 TaxID=3032599 RepID=UPI0023DC30D2|nr:SCO family protein [Albimonas sp. CAU 1670]MDF2232490.1 SCO family protein [Albimonas sp. CAU 1670]
MPKPNAARAAAFAGLAVALGGLAAGAWFAFAPTGGDDRFAQCRASALAPGAAAIGGPFEMTDQTGRTVTDADVIDGLTLVYFGYTFCPDVCPFDTANMAQTTEILEDRGILVTPVFVTIDPARDTPQALSDFVGALHPRMVGLSGTPEQTAAIAKAYKAYYAKQGDDPEDYLMDHSTFTYLMAPEVGFLDVFRRDIPPAEVADRVQCFAERL